VDTWRGMRGEGIVMVAERRIWRCYMVSEDGMNTRIKG
jgi:hypothetical protein